MSSKSGSPSTNEHTVRIVKNCRKKYNIMAFNQRDGVNFSSWTQAHMERDKSAMQMYVNEEKPEGAAGSEYGKKQREEARQKRSGIVTQESKLEDQPWILNVNGKSGKKFKGRKMSRVGENASYYIFKKRPDGDIAAFPVQGWYNFTPMAKHRTLTAEEAEEEWGRRNKVMNHFSIMLQKRFREQERGDDEEDEADTSGKKKKGVRRGGDLRIYDLEDDLEMSSDDSDSSTEDDGESKMKTKKDTGKGKEKKKKRKSDDEALEDSDDGDYEGLEVDYASDESSSSDEEQEKGKPSRGEDHPKGIDEVSESEEESEEEKPNDEDAKEEDDEEEDDTKKTPVLVKKNKEKDSGGESESSDDSDIEAETSVVLSMHTPKYGSRHDSLDISKTGSRPETPSRDSASSTLRAAAYKTEQGKRQMQGPGSDSPAGKRLKMEPSSHSLVPFGKSLPQPPFGKSTPISGDVQLTEEAVRQYLISKPMTSNDLLKKFPTKRTGLSSEQTVSMLAQILRSLNPDRKNVNDKMHFFLTQ